MKCKLLQNMSLKLDKTRHFKKKSITLISINAVEETVPVNKK